MRELNDRMEFEHVIRVHEDGTITDEHSPYAPDVYVEYDSEGKSTIGGLGDWTLMDGYSGQWRYSGPIMHSSEYIGGGMERDILATPGYYVAVIVYDMSAEPDETDGYDVDGWAVAYRECE